MPRKGVTSEKSRPHARVICSHDGTTLLVGSKSIQPLPGTNSDTHAWETSAPARAWLAGRRAREQIAAHVTRRQAARTQARDHQMGKVLAHAALLLEKFHHRRGDVGRRRIEFKLAVNFRHQRCRRFQNRPARFKTIAGIGSESYVSLARKGTRTEIAWHRASLGSGCHAGAVGERRREPFPRRAFVLDRSAAVAPPPRSFGRRYPRRCAPLRWRSRSLDCRRRRSFCAVESASV